MTLTTRVFPWLLLLPLFPVLRDFAEAQTLAYPFHLSESLLFNLMWWIFVPGIYLAHHYLTLYSTRRLPLALVVSMLHVVSYLLLSKGLSFLFFDNRYELFQFGSYLLYRDFALVLTVYLALALLLPRREHKKTVLVVKNGKESTLIPLKDIAYLQACSPYVSLHLHRKKYLYTSSLKGVLSELPSDHFLQIHRNTIVNTHHIKGMTSRLNGDYDLHLLTGEAEQNLRPCPKKTPIHGSKNTLSHV
jgi:hypothetical protein